MCTEALAAARSTPLVAASIRPLSCRTRISTHAAGLEVGLVGTRREVGRDRLAQVLELIEERQTRDDQFHVAVLRGQGGQVLRSGELLTGPELRR